VTFLSDTNVKMATVASIVTAAVIAAIAWGQTTERIDSIEDNQEAHEIRAKETVKDLNAQLGDIDDKQDTIRMEQVKIQTLLERLIVEVQEQD